MVAITGIDIVRIEDGKFAEYWLNADTLFFLQQAGVKEAPALSSLPPPSPYEASRSLSGLLTAT